MILAVLLGKKSNVKIRNLTRWFPPRQDYIKLNVKGSTDKNGKSAA